MIIFGNNTTGSSINKAKDNEQDTRLDSLQSAVNVLNTEIETIQTALNSLSDSIDDKYAAQTQTLMGELNSQIQSLINNLEDFVNTDQLNATVGNIQQLSASVSANLKAITTDTLTASGTVTAGSVDSTSLEADSATITSLISSAATLEEATINLLNVANFSITNLNAENITSETADIDTIEAVNIETDSVKTKHIYNDSWQTPISTPDNTELLKVTIPVNGQTVFFFTQDDKIRVAILSGSMLTYSQESLLIYRVEWVGDNVNLYLQNIGDTVNYTCLGVSLDEIENVSSEIVDKTNYEQNVLMTEGVSQKNPTLCWGVQVLWCETLPDTGEEGYVYFTTSAGAYLWKSSTETFYPFADLTSSITGAASTVASDNLTADKVVISDANGKIAAASYGPSEVQLKDLGTSDKIVVTDSDGAISVSDTALSDLQEKNLGRADKVVTTDATGAIDVSDVSTSQLKQIVNSFISPYGPNGSVSFSDGTSPTINHFVTFNSKLLAFTENGVYYAVEGAESFTLISGSPIGLVASCEYNGVLYAIDSSKVYSTADGETWSELWECTLNSGSLFGIVVNNGYIYVVQNENDENKNHYFYVLDTEGTYITYQGFTGYSSAMYFNIMPAEQGFNYVFNLSGSLTFHNVYYDGSEVQRSSVSITTSLTVGNYLYIYELNSQIYFLTENYIALLTYDSDSAVYVLDDSVNVTDAYFYPPVISNGYMYLAQNGTVNYTRIDMNETWGTDVETGTAGSSIGCFGAIGTESLYVSKTGGGAYFFISQFTVDSVPTEDSPYLVLSGGVYSALATKQDTLSFDNYPTKSSTKSVKSGGIFSANAVIMASSTTITNAPTISSGSIIRVMFTSAITGSDTSTALSLTYNDTAYSVKVGKQGSLSNFVASYVDSAYTYLQAYTTLELAFDGSQFIIIGNPVVLSSSDYTIYADGHTVNQTKSILYSERQYGNIATSGDIFVKYNLSDIVNNFSIYKGVLRLGGASNSSYSFSFLLTVSFDTWCFVIISQSTNKAQLALDIDTKELTMLVTDKTLGFYSEELLLTKMDV